MMDFKNSGKTRGKKKARWKENEKRTGGRKENEGSQEESEGTKREL